MNTPHTPGPWHVEHPYGEEGTYISSPDTTLVAKVYNERDAKLLAAAEEMLKALQEYQLVDQWIVSNHPNDPFFEETLHLKLQHADHLRDAAIAKALPEQPSTKNNEPSTSP